MRCSRTKAPSLHRRYPASPVLRASPPPCTARTDPRGLSVSACHATGRASRVASIPLFHTCCRHYPGGTRSVLSSLASRPLPAFPVLRAGRLPHHFVSRPARRSLALQPAWSLSRPRRPVSSECFERCRYLHHPLRLLPAGATVAGRDSHPLGNGALSRRTVAAVIGRQARNVRTGYSPGGGAARGRRRAARSRRNAIHSMLLALTRANSNVSTAVISCGINATVPRAAPSISCRTHLTRRPDGARQAS